MFYKYTDKSLNMSPILIIGRVYLFIYKKRIKMP